MGWVVHSAGTVTVQVHHWSLETPAAGEGLCRANQQRRSQQGLNAMSIQPWLRSMIAGLSLCCWWSMQPCRTCCRVADLPNQAFKRAGWPVAPRGTCCADDENAALVQQHLLCLAGLAVAFAFDVHNVKFIAVAQLLRHSSRERNCLHSPIFRPSGPTPCSHTSLSCGEPWLAN